MNFQKESPTTLLWFGAGFCAVVFFMFIFYHQIDNNLIETEVESISLTANQQQAAIDGSIKDHATNLKSMSRTLQIIGDNANAVTSYLQNIENTLNIDTIIVANDTGIGRLSNLTQVDVIDSEAFQAAMQGETYVSRPIKSRFSGKKVLVASTPMKNEQGKIVGAVLVEYSIDYITDTLIALVDEADEKGYSIILDRNANVITHTDYRDDNISSFKNAEYEDGLTYSKLVENIKQRKHEGGGAIATLEDGTYILEYRPIKLRNWTVVVVSEDVSHTLIRDISEAIKYILIAMTLSFLIFLVSTLLLKRKGVKDIEHVAFYDDLTGLPNLVYFREQVKILQKKYPDMKFVIQKMDIKDFKAINEMFGNDVGNLVLQRLADTIKTVEEATFVCAHIGADEFLMFAGNGYLEQDDKVREAYEQHFRTLMPELSEHEFVFRYGRYFLESADEDVMEIINKAHMAHHMAKVNKDKKTYEYDDCFKKRVLRMAEITNKRKNAIEHNEFKVYLQPKINIFSEKIYGAEALVRWIENDGKMIYPNEFIPLFEQNGFIVHVDIHILKCVCRQIKLWLQAGYKIVPISVNFSRMHLQNPNFVDELKAICDSYGDIRQYIEVELTESATTENVDDLAHVLKELHEAGFSIAIDDFGAGYSSLGMLKNFTVDCLKLDKSFFDENKDDSRGDIVVDGIIKIAKTLGMKIVAEGIETADQIEFLKSIKCEIVQGYYYAKPMPLSEFEQSYMREYENAAN